MKKGYRFWATSVLPILMSLFLSYTILYSQNTDLPVGAIPGTIDVSPMGAATYTIPIEVVPGTQGIQPNLSIVYNSQSGMGLLGMKWHLGGLSSITRIGQTLYYDDNTTGVQLNSEDRFALDGNRLMLIDGATYGGNNTTYAFEVEDFTRVVYHNSGSDDYFTVTLDGGNRVEYGKEFGSRQLLGSNTLTWMVSKITDPYGNYMTFHYEQYHGEIWITQIKYTGNVAVWMNTYAHVRFYYTDDYAGKNTAYIGGEEIFHTKLLERISISYDNQLAREYRFDYEQEKSPHLTKITLVGEDGTSLNPTVIEWGERVTEVDIKTTASLPNGFYLTGDFNGDGHCDIICHNLDIASDYRTAKWKLYIGNSNGNFTYKSEGSYNYLWRKVIFRVGDFDGDGKDDLLIGEKINTNKHRFFITNFHTTGQVASSPEIGMYDYCRDVHLGDFNGDERCDISIITTNGENSNFYYVHFYGSYGINLPKHPFIFPNNNEVRFHITDFDGDGKSDIQITHDLETKTYKYNKVGNTEYFSLLSSSGFPTIKHYTYYGDFNGDGKEDLLTYDTAGGNWDLWLHKGKDIYTHPEYTFPDHVLNRDMHSNGIELIYELFIADINGDGKDDIMQFTFTGNTMTGRCLRILISKGFYNGEYHYSYYEISHEKMYNTATKNTFNIGDLNGDGILDLLHKSSPIPIIISFNKNEQYEFVQSISDGHQKEIQLNYKPHTVKSLRILHPNLIRIFRTYVVDEVQYSNGMNGINNMNTISYEYQGLAYYSFKRKTYLGPDIFSMIDPQRETKTTRTYDLDINTDMYKLVSEKNTNLNGTTTYFNRSLVYSKLFLNNYTRYIFITTETLNDYLKGEKVKTNITLNPQGRIQKKTVQNLTGSNFLTKEETEYTYTHVTLPNGHVQPLPQNVVTKTYLNNSSTLFLQDNISYSYSNGRLNTVTQSGRTTTYSHYNHFGQAQKETVTCGSLPPLEINYQYDSRGRFLIGKSNSLSHTAAYTYESKTGNMLTKTDINNLTTTYKYDAFGRQRKITYPDGISDQLSMSWYNSLDIPNALYCTTSSSSGAKPQVKIYYDRLGREVCRKEGSEYIQTEYDRYGNIIAVSLPHKTLSDPNIIWNNYVYDHHGRKTEETGPYTDISYTYSPGITTMTDNLRNITYTKQYDAAGRLISATDPGGTISYAYNLAKDAGNITRSKMQISHHGQNTIVWADHNGNRTQIDDPNAGTITSQYNTLGELIRQEDANGNVTTFEYDQLGRVLKKTTTNGNQSDTLEYEYDYYIAIRRGKGKIRTVKLNGSQKERYDYDKLGRIMRYHKNTSAGEMAFSYTYNENGLLNVIRYPYNFAIQHTYNAKGELTEIRDYSDQSLIYKIYTRNHFGQVTLAGYGNNLATRYVYNDYGLLTQIKTGNKVIPIFEPGKSTIVPGGEAELFFEVNNAYQDLQYTYNNLGLMSNRKNARNNQSEIFSYDNLDRLTYFGAMKKVPIGGRILENIFYDNQGNITSTAYTGDYTYEINTSKPHAVEQLTLTSSNSSKISASDCAVEYTMFNKAKTITEDNWHLELFYGADQQREKTVLKEDNNVVKTKYFCGDLYERVITSEDTSHLNYIYAANQLVAIMKMGTDDSGGTGGISNPDSGISILSMTTTTTPNNGGTIFYIHTDHLSSYNYITDASKNRIDSLHFDPWGNRMKYHRWTQPDTGRTFFSDRGFTGHEHLDQFKIINMNGRLYDPVIARFFSPDPFVQLPDFTQNYNRYSYCLNNPLMYTDPDGEWVHLVIGAIVGGMMNWMTNGAEISWKGLAQFGIGAAAGLLGAGVGAGISSAVVGGSFGAGFVGSSAALTSTGFAAGMASGMGAGLSSGFVLGAGNSWMGGNNFGQGLLDGFKGGVIGGVTGGIAGGIFGGIDAASMDRDFWTGSYKQHDLELNYIASADGTTMFDQYSFPDNATVANGDAYRVYYNHENGVSGISDYVDPGKYIEWPVEGVATSKYTDHVYKIPSSGKVVVQRGGDVSLSINKVKLNAYKAYYRVRFGHPYQYGWLDKSYFQSINAYTEMWSSLFNNALLIR